MRRSVSLLGMAIMVGGIVMAGPGRAAAMQDMQKPSPAVHRAASANAEASAKTRSAPTDVSSQRRARRAPTRIRVYRMPGSYPGPNAVRECRAWYAEEFRPSGTVIVPRMRCWWRR